MIASGYAGLGANLLRTVPHTVLTFVIVGALRARVEQLEAPSLKAILPDERRQREAEAQLLALVPTAPAVARSVTQTTTRVVR